MTSNATEPAAPVRARRSAGSQPLGLEYTVQHHDPDCIPKRAPRPLPAVTAPYGGGLIDGEDHRIPAESRIMLHAPGATPPPVK